MEALGWTIAIYLLLVPAAMAGGMLGLGGNALLYVALRKAVPPGMGRQVRGLMRTSGALARHRKAIGSASGAAYAGGLAFALVWPVPGLAVAFVGGVGLGFVLAAVVVQRLWARLSPRVPDGPPMAFVEGFDAALRLFPVALVSGGLLGALLLLGWAWSTPDHRWIAWLALLPAAQAWGGYAWLRRGRSSGRIRKGP